MAARTNSGSGSSSSGNDSAIAAGDTPSSSSSASSPPASTSLKKWTRNLRDSCRWYGGIPCERPRTCYDCLNVQLLTADCALDPTGTCVPISIYEGYLRTRSNDTTESTYYPTFNYSYCASSDATCASCKAAWLQNASSSTSISASSCVGVGGCVCVAYCELPRWNESILERYLCSSPPPSPAPMAAPDDSIITSIDHEAAGYKLLTALGIGLGLVVVFSAIAMGVRYVVRVLEARAEEARLNRRRRPARVLKAPLLNLMGWKGMMETLIETEREHLAGDGGPRHVLSTEGPVVVVEEGEGYRPASPSEHDRPRV